MTNAQLRALCAAILRAELEPDGINVTADEKTAYAVEQADRLLAALGIAQEEPVSNADELVAIRARVAELERQYAPDQAAQLRAQVLLAGDLAAQVRELAQEYQTTPAALIRELVVDGLRLRRRLMDTG